MLSEKLKRAKCKGILRPFAQQVWEGAGLAFKLPDNIIDKLPESLDKYVTDILENDFHLVRERGLWTNKRH